MRMGYIKNLEIAVQGGTASRKELINYLKLGGQISIKQWIKIILFI
jgi:hypothetical protein